MVVYRKRREVVELLSHSRLFMIEQGLGEVGQGCKEVYDYIEDGIVMDVAAAATE